MTNEDLLRAIEKGAADFGMAPSTLCLRAAGAGHLPARLRGGGSTTLTIANKILAYIEDERTRRLRERAA